MRSASKVSIRSKLPFNPLETLLVFSSCLIAMILLKTFQVCRLLLRFPLQYKYICQLCRQHQAHVIQHSHQVTFFCWVHGLCYTHEEYMLCYTHVIHMKSNIHPLTSSKTEASKEPWPSYELVCFCESIHKAVLFAHSVYHSTSSKPFAGSSTILLSTTSSPWNTKDDLNKTLTSREAKLWNSSNWRHSLDKNTSLLYLGRNMLQGVQLLTKTSPQSAIL